MSNVYQFSKSQGFTRMDNDLCEALIRADLSGRELRVALAIHRLTAGFNKNSVKVAALYISKMMYSDGQRAEAERANVSRSINSLIRQRVIFRDGGSRDPIAFLPVLEWKIDPKSSVLKSTHCVENIPSTVLKITHNKDSKDNISPSEIVDAECQPIESAPIKIKRPASKIESCPHQAIVDLYHEILPELPSIALLNKTRQSHLQARWREHAAHRDLEFWREYFQAVKSSPFLMGQVQGRMGGKPFRASFDWLIAASNFVKVVEGNYNA